MSPTLRVSLAILAGAAMVGCRSYPATVAPPALEGVRVVEDGYEIRLVAESDAGAVGSAEVPGVIFYPGGLVEPAAYLSMLAPLAASGYPVVVIRMPLDLAVFGRNRAEDTLARDPDRRWVMGGHSLGGAMAARFLADRGTEFVSVEGLFLLGSYPADDLSSSSLKVVSVWASEDGLATREDRENTTELLPASTSYVMIEGGNHAGFGTYGPQAEDGERSITLDEQHRLTREAIIGLLEQVTPP